MQPDGTLNPSADPPELPDPSDSGPSYWLARTVWALGEGYAAWRTADRRSRAFLRDRLDLAIAALDRQVLARYGTWQIVDGERAPAWLIVDGADATAEAVLGLAAYVAAGGGGVGPARAAAVRRGHRGAVRRRRARVAVRRGAPVGTVAVGLARLGLADAGRAGPRRARSR